MATPARRPLTLPLLTLLAVLAMALCVAPAVAAPVSAAPPGATDPGPLVTLAVMQATLTPSAGTTADWFGIRVAIHGNTAVVGSPNKKVGDMARHGAAWVFARTNAAAPWTQQATLTLTDGRASDDFGSSVAVAGDTVLVGASGRQEFTGAVYVFTRSASSWTLRHEILAADGAAYATFGDSVDLSGDTAIIGASGSGAYVFTRSGTTWVQQAKLPYAGSASDTLFGHCVAVDGDTAVVSAMNEPIGDTQYQGAAYVYQRRGAGWAQQGKLTADDGATSNQFGFAVDVSGDTVLVGARKGGALNHGAAYVFTRNGAGAWSQQAKLVGSDVRAGESFAEAVALAKDTALVGARFKDGFVGAAFVFTRSGATWSQSEKLVAKDRRPGAQFGTSVALSGSTFLIGAPGEKVGSNDLQGLVYVFGPEATPEKPRLSKLSPAMGKRGASVSLTGSGFGAARGTSVVKFGTAKVTRFVSWAAGKIVVKVPAKAKLGKNRVTVTTSAGVSAARTFTVKR